jgi:hypothetical protein
MASLATKVIARLQHFFAFLNLAYVHCAVAPFDDRVVPQALSCRDYCSPCCYPQGVSQFSRICIRSLPKQCAFFRLHCHFSSCHFSVRVGERLCLYLKLLSTGMDNWSVRHPSVVLLSDVSPGGFDTVVHISEEARNASRAVPFAMISGTVLISVLGWSEPHRTLVAFS